MLGIKLVDVDTSDAREEQTGTCELCFGSAWCDNPILILKIQKVTVPKSMAIVGSGEIILSLRLTTI